jgi:hypothetical protein
MCLFNHLNTTTVGEIVEANFLIPDVLSVSLKARANVVEEIFFCNQNSGTLDRVLSV